MGLWSIAWEIKHFAINSPTDYQPKNQPTKNQKTS